MKFPISFAAAGDRATIPQALQPDGSVSFTEGFGPDYELDKTVDPINAKDVPRDQTNELYFGITEALNEVQKQGVSSWDAVMVPYPINSIVRHSDKAWQSSIANNSSVPGDDSNWKDVTLMIQPASQIEVDAGVQDYTAVTPETLKGDLVFASGSISGRPYAYIKEPARRGGRLKYVARIAVPPEVGAHYITIPVSFASGACTFLSRDSTAISTDADLKVVAATSGSTITVTRATAATSASQWAVLVEGFPA